MSGKVEARLAEIGITLPEPVAPVANYVPFTIVGNTLYLSGQVSKGPDGLITGLLGQDVTVEQGYEAARVCAVNLIVQIKAAVGDLDRVTRIARLGAFVACVPGFTDQPRVVNGASDLMVEAFGDAGRHARSAVGTNALPLGVAVEIDAIVEFA